MSIFSILRAIIFFSLYNKINTYLDSTHPIPLISISSFVVRIVIRFRLSSPHTLLLLCTGDPYLMLLDDDVIIFFCFSVAPPHDTFTPKDFVES